MRKLFTGFFLLLSLFTFSQLRELRFKRLTVEDGLPENFSTCALQDKFGYIWFGTQDGLFRYDGYMLKPFKLQTEDEWEPSYRHTWSLAEDKSGSIWIGTSNEGIFQLNRNTGKFVNFKHPENSELRSEKASHIKLAIDKEGMVWTGIYLPNMKKMLLDRLDPSMGRFVTYDSTSAGTWDLRSTVAPVYNMLLTSDSNFWIGNDRGLHKFDYTSKKFITILKNDIRYIYEAPSQSGVLWLSQKQGKSFVLTKYDIRTGSMELFPRNSSLVNSIHSDTAAAIYESKAKDLWITTANGISLFNRQTSSFKSFIPENPFPEDSLSNLCLDIMEGRNGQLWVRTLRKGLLYLSSPLALLKRFVYDENRPDGLPNNTLWVSSFTDRDGNLWVNTRGDGINKLDEKASQLEYVKRYSDRSKYPGGELLGVGNLDEKQALLITWNGLYRYNKIDSQFAAIHIPFVKEKKIRLRKIFIDRAGISWLSSLDGGLISYDPKSGMAKQYVNNPSDSFSLVSNYVTAIYEDSKLNFWVGTYGGGLNKLDRNTGKFTRYPFSPGQTDLDKGVLDDDDVTSIYEDRQGTLWIGTNNGSLNRMEQATGKFTSYYKKDDRMICVISIYEDSKERLWIGTYLKGLYLLDRKTGSRRVFTEKEGLAFNQVFDIKEDEQGRIWLASQRGFSVLDGNDFSISYLNVSNGLPNNYNSGRSIYKLDNDWVVGTKDGFIRFRPGELLKSNKPPKVLIQSVAFNHGKLDSTIFIGDQNELSFDYNENRLQFQFVGLHYSNPSLNQYQYKLDGYDKDWIKAGTQRAALYTNLSPGHYRFWVKSANSDGVWSEPTSIEVIIHPPWWKTWWAYTLYAVVFILSIGAFIAYRSKALRRQNRVLEEKVEHRTKQLKQSIEELKATQAQLVQSEKMASLGELTAGIAHEIQNPLNFINNFSEVSSELLHEMKEEIDAGNTGEVKAIAGDLDKNLEKIVFHGKRADSIVKNMLQHSRQNAGQKEPVDINAFVDEYLRLSYHGLRARDKSFNAIMETNFDPAVGKVPIVAQDIGRVLLNLFNNAFYSVMEKKKHLANGFGPTLFVNTQRKNGSVEITIKDNGNGIPKEIIDKIYQPFFTTKPTGEGTGLGLSMSYDIITKGHGGQLQVETKEGEYALFRITLP